jgi:predicted anti-sigma-YlaC factor YlaD
MTDLLEDELTLAERIELGRHLAVCRSCRDYVGQLLATIEMLRGLPEPMLAVLRFEPFHYFRGSRS